MTIDAPVSEQARRPGTGRLHLVVGYFQLGGVAGGVLTVGLLGGLIAPPPDLAHSALHRLVNLGAAAAFTYGAFRTSWLLDRRRREGAHHALGFFLVPLVGLATGLIPTSPALLIPSIGIGLLATVWRYLE